MSSENEDFERRFEDLHKMIGEILKIMKEKEITPEKALEEFIRTKNDAKTNLSKEEKEKIIGVCKKGLPKNPTPKEYTEEWKDKFFNG